MNRIKKLIDRSAYKGEHSETLSPTENVQLQRCSAFLDKGGGADLKETQTIQNNDNRQGRRPPDKIASRPNGVGLRGTGPKQGLAETREWKVPAVLMRRGFEQRLFRDWGRQVTVRLGGGGGGGAGRE